MPIIKCSHCKKEYNLDKKLSWKRGKCINCWNEFLITFENKKKNITYYILQSIKWFFIFFLSGILLLSVSIFISKLNLYKQSDFNIPKDFFNTQFWDKDPYSSENGYNDFVDFIKLLDKKDIWYIDFHKLSYLLFLILNCLFTFSINGWKLLWIVITTLNFLLSYIFYQYMRMIMKNS